MTTNKTPASRMLLNLTEALWLSAQKECKEIEAATIERCAQVAEEPFHSDGKEIAAAIRALKGADEK